MLDHLATLAAPRLSGALLGAVMTIATLAATVQTSHAAQVQVVTGKSGVTAWLVEDYTVPVIATQFAFSGGAAQDPAGRPGVAYLMSGMLDEGAGPLDFTAFQAKLDELAVELRFDARYDHFSGAMKTLAANRDEAFDLLKLALGSPRFETEPLERVRGQIASSLRREEKDPDAIARRVSDAAAFPDHPYGRPIKGTLDSLAAITREDVVAMHRRLIAREGLKIAVVGAIDAATLRMLLDATFGDLPAKGALQPIPAVVPAGLGARKLVDFETPQSVIRILGEGLSRPDPDFIPAFVVNHIYGGGSFTSRLFTEVREKRGLAYGVFSALAPRERAALFVMGTSTRNERAGEAVGVIMDELTRIGREGPSADELAKAKSFLTGSYALRFDTSGKIAGELLQLQLDGFGPDYIAKRNGLIEAVTLEDARRAARRLYGDGRFLTVVVGRPQGL